MRTAQPLPLHIPRAVGGDQKSERPVASSCDMTTHQLPVTVGKELADPVRSKHPMIRVAIIEDDPGLRQDLTEQLAQFSDMEIVGQFPTAESAVGGLPGLHADVVLTDIQLPGRSGIELVRGLKPGLGASEFLMLTSFEDNELVFDALRSGAVGYILKRSQPSEIATAIREVSTGGSPMTSSIARKVVVALRQPAAEPSPQLSERERGLLNQLVQGRSYKECASDLNISLDTVRTYIRRIYKKLQVHTRHEAITKAHRITPSAELSTKPNTQSLLRAKID